MRFPVTVIGGWLFLSFLSAAAAEDWKFSSSVNYDTGKYGTSDRTSSLYIPFTLKRYFGDASLSVTVPYLRQTSVGAVTLVGGRPSRTGMRMTRTSLTAKETTESGLGDILLKGGYPLASERRNSFYLGLAGTLKLPTADRDKGLGTGETDAGGGLEFSKDMPGNWTLLSDAYFTSIGSPPGQDYRDQAAFDIGFSRKAGGDLVFTALYETSNSLVRGAPAPRDVSFTLEGPAADGNRYSGGVLFGLSDGSPDLGLSAGVSRRF
ncbi:MAG: transporter [Elusimicrobia bacterium]|nr:transporter [Elusimicrobiota bacterium]